MITVYSHKTALRLLENAARPFAIDKSVDIPTESFAHAVGQLNEASITMLRQDGLRLELASSHREDRRSGARLRVHNVSAQLLCKNMLKVAKGQYTVSPELAFFQVASTLDLTGAILLGMEMCGGYSLRSKETPGQDCKAGFVSRKPLTAVAKLLRLLPSLPECYRPKNVVRALNYILDGAESPMETAAYLILCMPMAFGGFGIERPTLNHTIGINAALKTVASSSSYRYDLFWPKQKVAVEYDSATWHSAPDKYHKDGMRRNHSNYMGITVISAYGIDFAELKHSQVFAKQLAHALGSRLRIRSPHFLSNTMELRARVLNQKPFA